MFSRSSCCLFNFLFSDCNSFSYSLISLFNCLILPSFVLIARSQFKSSIFCSIYEILLDVFSTSDSKISLLLLFSSINKIAFFVSPKPFLTLFQIFLISSFN